MTATRTPKILLTFYRSASGNEAVREWLKALTLADRKEVGQDLMRVRYRWPVGMPLCRPMGQGLWEVRGSLPNNRIARVVFCQCGMLLVALHAFIKKTPATPPADLALARQRMKELES